MTTASSDPETSKVSITVIEVMPARTGKLFALVSIELDIDGVQIQVHGIRAVRVVPVGTRIELPQFRNTSGFMQPAIRLPAELRGAIGDAVLDALIEQGLAKPRFAAPGLE